MKAQELFIAGFGSLLAMTASLYSRYKLHVNSIHRQSEAALEAQNALEAMSGWRQQGPEWVMVPKITRDRDTRGVTRKHFPPLSFPLVILVRLSLLICEMGINVNVGHGVPCITFHWCCHLPGCPPMTAVQDSQLLAVPDQCPRAEMRVGWKQSCSPCVGPAKSRSQSHLHCHRCPPPAALFTSLLKYFLGCPVGHGTPLPECQELCQGSKLLPSPAWSSVRHQDPTPSSCIFGCGDGGAWGPSSLTGG